jgi:hypothetical protein
MKTYLYYISRVMQAACYKTDIEIGENDVMFGAGGRFQSDHIISNTNIEGAESDKEFHYTYKATSGYSVLDFLTEGAKTMLVLYMFHELFTVEHSSNLRDDLSKHYEAVSPIQLTSQVLDDPSNARLITMFNDMRVDINLPFSALSDLARTVDIDISDVAFFTEEMWDSYTINTNKTYKVATLYKNIIKRRCGGCVLCYILGGSEVVYCHNLPVKYLVRLEFHHVVESKKICNISNLITSEELEVELPKVVCLCTPHHFYITNKRGEYESKLTEFILSSKYMIDENTGNLVKIDE